MNIFPIENLYVSDSAIPYSGKGLFTKCPINKGILIIEYTGEITTWEAVRHESSNVYIYFVNEDHVIDAKRNIKALARYANDAKGPAQIKGIDNNSTFVNLEGRVYIKSIKNIAARSEILVDYGKEYWETVKKNTGLKKTTKFPKRFY
jgi:SET domain-containing protein